MTNTPTNSGINLSLSSCKLSLARDAPSKYLNLAYKVICDANTLVCEINHSKLARKLTHSHTNYRNSLFNSLKPQTPLRIGISKTFTLCCHRAQQLIVHVLCITKLLHESVIDSSIWFSSITNSTPGKNLRFARKNLVSLNTHLSINKFRLPKLKSHPIRDNKETKLKFYNTSNRNTNKHTCLNKSFFVFVYSRQKQSLTRQANRVMSATDKPTTKIGAKPNPNLKKPESEIVLNQGSNSEATGAKSNTTPRKPELVNLPDYDSESDTELNSTIRNISITSKVPSATKSKSIKRQRDTPNTSLTSNELQAKRIKPFIEMLPGMAAMVAMESYVVDIVPTEEALTLTEAQGKMVGSSLTRALFAAENFAALKFESSGYDRGRYRTICSDTTTRDWVVGIVDRLEGLWTGADLRAVKSGAPARLVRATVNVNLPYMEPNDMFTIIATQNPDINTDNWKLYSRAKAVAGKQQWIIGVDESSIPALRNVNCRPHCGMGRIRIILPNNAV